MRSDSGNSSGGMLDGLAVLEVGQRVAAPYCAKLLADLGADVIKVEPPGAGDPARERGPFPNDEPHREQSGLFLYLNTNKRSITLSLETRAGRRLLHELIGRADVLIEDAAPADRVRLGLDEETVAGTNSRLVHTSITPFGPDGPYRDFRTHHLNVYHASPHTTFSRVDGDARPPAKAGRYLAEYDAGLTAALGTLAAAFGSAATGVGERIEVSKQEALLSIERVDIGRQINPPGPSKWRGSVSGLLPAKDGYVMVTPAQDHQWQGLVRAMGSPDWALSEACKDEVSRQEHRDEIQPRIEEWSRGCTRDELYHRLQDEGTPAGPVWNVAEVREWVQARERGFFAEIDHPEAGEQTYPTVPYRFSGQTFVGSRAPLLGEHNESVLSDELGYTRDDLATLADRGVIG